MSRARTLSFLSLGTAVLIVPFLSDGSPPPCNDVTTSLMSQENNPVAGDEQFFTLPSGPSNVMFMQDVSGSMANIPQCGDCNYWGDGTGCLSTCQLPTFANVSAPTTSGTINGDGICAGYPSTFATSNTSLAWMTNYTPTATLVDPGLGTASNGLVDTPSWGNAGTTAATNCTLAANPSTACLFQSGQIFSYPTASNGNYNWTETSAAPFTAGPTTISGVSGGSWSLNGCTLTVTWNDVTCPGTCSGSNCAITTVKTANFNLPNCASCLTNTGAPGFYFFKNWQAAFNVSTASVTSSTHHGVTTYTCTASSNLAIAQSPGTATALLSGGWLNANPPKFMSARHVIKQVAWINPNVSQPTDQLRLGLSYMTNATLPSPFGSNGVAIVVPLGPDTADSYPVNPSAFVAVRQTIMNAYNHNWPGGVTLPSLDNGGTPMATGLFHLGQYFTQSGTYTTAFGSSYELSAYAQTSAGLMKASWVSSSSSSFCWSCQKSAIIIVTDGSPNSEMTFPTVIESKTGSNWSGYAQNLYTSTQNCGPGTQCSSSPSACCSPSDTTSAAPSPLPRIAAWLDQNDLSPSTLNGLQTVVTQAVSFNLAAGNAQTILQSTANMGGGSFNNAADGTGLAAGVAQAISQVSNTSTSFGAPAASSLTTINSFDTKAFITRFRPNQKATWEGHLFQWMLFDEAAAGCDPSKKYNASDPTQQVICRGKIVSANFDGSTTPLGYNICNKSFLVDANCDEITENSQTGVWYKTGTGNTPAQMFWDAGQVLSTPGTTGYLTAAEHADTGNIAPYTTYAPGQTPRNIWTALPDGTPYELETKNAATLAPYMNLTQSWCTTMESLAKLCGSSPLPACPAISSTATWTGSTWAGSTAETYCAEQVILFARGWDVMDQDGDGCAGPGNPSNGTYNITSDGLLNTHLCAITTGHTAEERNRVNDAAAFTGPYQAGVTITVSTSLPTFYKLGDVFHSSPVMVHQPTAEAVCQLGTDNQCVRTLFGYSGNVNYGPGYQTSLESDYPGCQAGSAKVDAYRAWRSSLASRETAVIVGSNDGLLHAFDAGGPDPSQSSEDADCVYPGITDGTGEELWAFVPPDLLPLLQATMMNHTYTVDGNTMVRDIWVDGIAGTGNNLDGVKQKNEFRTIAILSERAGGMQFTALDITNSFDMNLTDRTHPTMLWSFPPPLSDDAQYMGQSWSDFSPRPPPVGPVRLVPTSSDRDPQGKGWVEKWEVMLNGGYDPSLTRGRAVWMVDAWTGAVTWRFTDADFKANVVGSSANTTTSMFPVPAGIALVDIGNSTVGLPDSDNFFDTATWGDLGGNVFVARFWDPGVRGSNGRVTNWKAARTFEQSRRTDNGQYAGTRNEFFYMTANAFDPQRGTLHTLLGSGNREQILSQTLECSPDDIFGCCQAGCTVSTSSQVNYGTCSSSGSFACASTGQMTSPALTEGCGASGAAACTNGASGNFTASDSYTITCSTSAGTTATGTTTCSSAGLCTVSPVGTGHNVAPPTTGSCPDKARFYGIWSYGGLAAQKSFSTSPSADWSTAQTFDQNRFTDAANYTGCAFTAGQVAGSCSLIETTQAQVNASGGLSCASGATCQATVDDPGWFYTYNTGPCPTQQACASGCTFEKTASGATVLNSCASWNSFLPLGSASSGSSTDPCASAGTATQTAVAYATNYVSGTASTNCNEGSSPTQIFAGLQESTIAPPAAPMVQLGVTSTGQVYYNTVQLNPGQPAANTSLGSRSLASTLYWLPVSPASHNCRHAGQNCE